MPPLLTRCELQMRRKLGIAFMCICLLTATGCYHARVYAPQPDPSTEYKKLTVHNIAWGLYKTKDAHATDCLANAIDEVRVSSNFGYSLLTTVTLGFWSPIKVEWRCSKPHEEPDTIHKPKPKPTPTPQNQPQDRTPQ
jgi:hypothetical protein